MAKRAGKSTATKSGPGKRQSGKPLDPVDAALHLAATSGWQGVSLNDIAEASGLSLAELYENYRSKQALLNAFTARIDQAVLTDAAALSDPQDTPRDRLFAVLMARFDKMQPYRDALTSIVKAARRDPVMALGGLPAFARSMQWMLSAAGVDTGGLAGRMRLRAAGLLYLDAARVWLVDESADLSKTMAHLDGCLRTAEKVMNSMPWKKRAGSQKAAAA